MGPHVLYACMRAEGAVRRHCCTEALTTMHPGKGWSMGTCERVGNGERVVCCLPPSVVLAWVLALPSNVPELGAPKSTKSTSLSSASVSIKWSLSSLLSLPSSGMESGSTKVPAHGDGLHDRRT